MRSSRKFHSNLPGKHRFVLELILPKKECPSILGNCERRILRKDLPFKQSTQLLDLKPRKCRNHITE